MAPYIFHNKKIRRKMLIKTTNALVDIFRQYYFCFVLEHYKFINF